LPENNPEIAPETLNPGNPEIPLDSDKTQLGTAENIQNSPISATPVIDTTTDRQIATRKSTNPLQRISRAVGQILTPKTPPSDAQEQNQPSATKNVPNTPTSVPNAPLTKDHHSRPTTRQETTQCFPTCQSMKLF
jgi:hypothetical protein